MIYGDRKKIEQAIIEYGHAVAGGADPQKAWTKVQAALDGIDLEPAVSEWKCPKCGYGHTVEFETIPPRIVCGQCYEPVKPAPQDKGCELCDNLAVPGKDYCLVCYDNGVIDPVYDAPDEIAQGMAANGSGDGPIEDPVCEGLKSLGLDYHNEHCTKCRRR